MLSMKASIWRLLLKSTVPGSVSIQERCWRIRFTVPGDNRKMLKGKGSGILLRAKPLGRPSASALSIHVSPGERNPIEGKFGQAKTGYGLNRIKARLKQTSESWIAGIFLVLNLVKLAEAAASCLMVKIWLHFSAWMPEMLPLPFTLCRGNIQRHSFVRLATVAA